MTTGVTHDNLVAAARIWLKEGLLYDIGGTRCYRRCSIVVSEMTSRGSEQPDALGWYDCWTHLVEVKISRADFLSDRKKPFRVDPATGMGDFRWFFVPPGVIKVKDELPAGWGWVVYDPDRLSARMKVEAVQQPAKNDRHEQLVLTSLLRRIAQARPRGVNIRCHVQSGKNKACLDIETVPEGDEPEFSFSEYFQVSRGDNE